MKYLILATGRDGSTQLFYAIHDRLESQNMGEPYTTVSEPYNYDLGVKTYFMKRNIVVKCIVNKYHIPESWNPEDGDTIDFFTGLALNFDKTILIRRKNKGKRLYSALHAHKHNTWKGEYKQKPITLDSNNLTDEIDDFIDAEIIAHELSKSFLTIYMEDLYTEDKELSQKTWNRIFPDEPVQIFESMYNKYLDVKHKKGKV